MSPSSTMFRMLAFALVLVPMRFGPNETVTARCKQSWSIHVLAANLPEQAIRTAESDFNGRRALGLDTYRQPTVSMAAVHPS